MLSPSGIATGAPTGAPSAPLLPTMPGGELPRLPDVIPAAPVAAAPADVRKDVLPDVKAMRSAQLKASRQQRQGKVFGRSVIAFFLIAAMIGAALIFGRPYLFPSEWDSRLVPVVDEVQLARGAEFVDAVPTVEQPEQRFGRTVSSIVLGDDWADRLPEWRALGLATGATTAETVATRMATVRGAIYDPGSATIYLNADVDPLTIRDDIRLAVEQAFAAQTSTIEPAEATGLGFTGTVALERLVAEAVDRAVAGVQLDVVADDPAVDTQPFPIPIAYQLAAVNQLGDALVGAAALDPASMTVGEIVSPLAALLDDGPVAATMNTLGPSDVAVTEPRALGVDDWSLVWGSRLPVSTVDELAALITADSYRVVDRAGRSCVLATFETASEADGARVAEALGVWGSTAPNETGTVVTRLEPTRVGIEACDPNMIAGTPSLSGVNHVIGRQIERLAGVAATETIEPAEVIEVVEPADAG